MQRQRQCCLGSIRPPDCSEAYAEPGCLWPPNHKFVDVAIMGVTDPDDDPVTIIVTAITLAPTCLLMLSVPQTSVVSIFRQ